MRFVLRLSLIFGSAILAASAASTLSARSTGVSGATSPGGVSAVRTPAAARSSHEGPAASCSDLNIRYDHGEPLIKSEEKTLTKAEAPTLRVQAETNGGVQIWGWDKDAYLVTACKFADVRDADADALLSQIHVSTANGEVSASGPAHRDRWSVFFLIRSPRAATIDLETRNGPVSFYGVDGKLNAKATNGPITIQDFTGDGDLRAQNGPISIFGSSGNLRVHTENGPITVALRSTTWTGAGLTADAENGPVTLQVPAGFQSSFLVESNGNGPVSCAASICGESRKTWDDDRKRIEFGSAPPVIHLSSYNGPVSVRNARE
jgi:hypothetical protein